jgi:hypothetical protein
VVMKVFPGSVYVPEIIVSKNVAMAADIEAFNAKPPRLWIYVYGRMEYRDIFGDHHTTSYCAKGETPKIERLNG